MTTDPSFLQALWFVLIGVLWAGFFVLEGFDFGVGMLVKVLGRDNVDKRMMIHTIGPVWDGNEVWLITAGGAMFAAFPEWYASVFSGFYLALFLILAALIIRGVSFEFWGKVDTPAWRSVWEWTLLIGSGLAALLFGVAWANFVHGVPMSPMVVHGITQHYVVHATIWDELHPYAILGGLTTLAVFLSHGASFLALRLTGDLQRRAKAAVGRVSVVAVVLAAAFLIWTMHLAHGRVSVIVLGALVILLLLAVPFIHARSEGRGFVASAGAILLLTATFCAGLYPNVLPSSTKASYNLTIAGAASTHYTLVVMTIVAVIFVPIVLAYTAWTYWVFRHRLGRDDYAGSLDPVSVLGSKLNS
jgi:cytochrome d ubiquinol oxidase subunit II